MTPPSQVSKKKRNRLTIVCRRCRRKKAKCDKAQPCGQCVKNQCPDDCVYDMANYDGNSGASGSLIPGAHGVNGTNGVGVDGVSNGFKTEDINAQIRSLVDKYFNQERKHSLLAGQSPPELPECRFRRSSVTPLLGYNPVLKSTDLMNLHMNFTEQQVPSQHASPVGNLEYIEPRFTHHFRNFKTTQRPIFFVELLQSDPGARLYWRLSDERDNVKLMTVQNFPMQKRQEVVKAAGAYFGRAFITSNQRNTAVAKDQLSTYGLPLGFTFTPCYSETDHFQVNLAKVLPHKNAVMAYIKHFFVSVYPSYPVVDEFWLVEETRTMFNFNHDGSFHSVNISSKQDLLLVSMVLYIIRLSYLSFFTNVRSQNKKILDSVQIGDRPLRDSPISFNAVNLASTLYQTGSLRSKPSFLLLQAGMLRCINRLLSFDNEIPFSHSDGDCNLGSLTSLAIALCLERDPDLIRNFPGGLKDRNLRRKVWYTLVHMDYLLSYVSHKPRIIYQAQYNTRLPEYEPMGCNIENFELEELVIKSMSRNFEVFSAGDDVLDTCLDMKSSFKASDVVQKLNDFELVLSEKFGSMSHYFKPNPSALSRVVSISQLSTHAAIQLFIAYAYYFFYLYYKYKGESSLSFFFLRKTLSITYSDFEYFGVDLMFTEEEYFSSSFTLLLTPLLLVLVHVVSMVGFALAVTMNCTILLSDTADVEPSRMQLLKYVAYKNETFSLRRQKFFKLLSERYFYAWKCTKMDGLAHSFLYQQSFYQVDVDWLRKASMSWTDEQIRKFSELVPDAPPILVKDPALVINFSYQSTMSIDDTDFTGTDLYKTVQTDNFWIVINTLVEREPNAFHASQSMRILQQKLDQNIQYSATKRREDFSQPVTPLNYSVLQPMQDGPAVDASVSEILDFDLFKTDWTVEDIL